MKNGKQLTRPRTLISCNNRIYITNDWRRCKLGFALHQKGIHLSTLLLVIDSNCPAGALYSYRIVLLDLFKSQAQSFGETQCMPATMDPNAITWPTQLTKSLHRDVYPLLEASSPDLSAAGKTVLITGATGGLGPVGHNTTQLSSPEKQTDARSSLRRSNADSKRFS
jgi:hypothetical protein